MQIALWMAYKHVYILGVDMNPSITGQLHFYGTNPDVDPDTRRKRFKEEARWYDKCAEILTEDEKHKFTFCSAYNPWDFVKKFDNIHHKDAIDRIIASIN
jgi:sugar phosphate isomerase/epimerase